MLPLSMTAKFPASVPSAFPETLPLVIVSYGRVRAIHRTAIVCDVDPMEVRTKVKPFPSVFPTRWRRWHPRITRLAKACTYFTTYPSKVTVSCDAADCPAVDTKCKSASGTWTSPQLLPDKMKKCSARWNLLCKDRCTVAIAVAHQESPEVNCKHYSYSSHCGKCRG